LIPEPVLNSTTVSPSFTIPCATSPRNYKEFREKISSLEIPILLGGRVFKDDSLRKRFECEYYARSFTEVAQFARNL